MIRPASFGSNPETLADNTFQQKEDIQLAELISRKAIEEFDKMVKVISEAGINVKVYEDTKEPIKSDAVFPNNWLMTDPNGSICTFPMYAQSRRPERREDIVLDLQKERKYKKRYGFEYLEPVGEFLEGTGSMVIDREYRKVYACLSNRTHIQVLDKFSILYDLQKISFHAFHNKKPIYHTNVLMSVGEGYAIICLDCILDEQQKKEVIESLQKDDKEIIPISIEQMSNFAGNVIQLISSSGESKLIMSKTSFNSLTADQIDRIEKYNKILPISIPTIEQYGGGSVRCMITELF